ncbi:MAG: hypothetical protein RSC68_31220, partial [Acinetobacter sp.]
MSDKARERAFQDHIIAELASTGWLIGDSAHYDKERALYPEDLIGFIQESQPEGWLKYCKTYSENPERHLSDAAVRQLTRPEG